MIEVDLYEKTVDGAPIIYTTSAADVNGNTRYKIFTGDNVFYLLDASAPSGFSDKRYKSLSGMYNSKLPKNVR